MAEYKSFHYLMHQVPDVVKPTYITSTVLSFGELYSPRSTVSLINKSEKSCAPETALNIPYMRIGIVKLYS